MNQLAANAAVQAISSRDKFISGDYSAGCPCNLQNGRGGSQSEKRKKESGGGVGRPQVPLNDARLADDAFRNVKLQLKPRQEAANNLRAATSQGLPWYLHERALQQPSPRPHESLKPS